MKLLILCALLSPIFIQAKEVKDGRYQLVQLGSARRDQYLLDTATGKVWQRLCLVPVKDECEYAPWFQMDIEGVSKKTGEIYEKAKAIESSFKK